LLDLVSFSIGDRVLDFVDFFKYLGRWLSRDDHEDKAISENIIKARALLCSPHSTTTYPSVT